MKSRKSIFVFAGCVLGIIVAIIAVIFGARISAEKHAIDAELRVKKYYEDIKAVEKSRVDSLQLLADSAMAHTNFESNVYADIANARKDIENGDFDEAHTNVNTALSAIVEAYPTIQSTELYKDYNKAVMTWEKDLEASRKAYNDGIRDYNKTLRDPIRKFFLSMTGYEKVEFKELSETLGDNSDLPNINWNN